MPILASETSIFPDNLFADLAASPDERKWWVVYTKARQEKALARNLLNHEVPFYLPLVANTQYNRGRRFTSYLPVFPGYLFLFGSEDERVTSLTTNRVSRILPVPDGHQLRDDLRKVRQMIETKVPLTVESRLVPGAASTRQMWLVGWIGRNDHRPSQGASLARRRALPAARRLSSDRRLYGRTNLTFSLLFRVNSSDRRTWTSVVEVTARPKRAHYPIWVCGPRPPQGCFDHSMP